MIATRIQFKHLADEAKAFRILHHSVRNEIIQISCRSHAYRFASPYFLPQTPLHILREIIHILFGLPKSDIEHEFALWRGIKPKRWEFERGELSRVREIDYTPSIDTIAR